MMHRSVPAGPASYHAETLTIRPRDPYLVLGGPSSAALAAFSRRGLAVWARPGAGATIYHQQGGQRAARHYQAWRYAPEAD